MIGPIRAIGQATLKQFYTQSPDWRAASVGLPLLSNVINYAEGSDASSLRFHQYQGALNDANVVNRHGEVVLGYSVAAGRFYSDLRVTPLEHYAYLSLLKEIQADKDENSAVTEQERALNAMVFQHIAYFLPLVQSTQADQLIYSEHFAALELRFESVLKQQVDLDTAATLSEKIEKILSCNAGIQFLTEHQDNATFDELDQLVASLAKAHVKHVFIEIPAQSRDAFERLNKNPDLAQLRQDLESFQLDPCIMEAGYSWREIEFAYLCAKQGMQVFPIDMYSENERDEATHNIVLTDEGSKERMRYSDKFMVNVVKSHLTSKPSDEKYIVISGAAHCAMSSAEHLNIPSVFLPGEGVNSMVSQSERRAIAQGDSQTLSVDDCLIAWDYVHFSSGLERR